jgi:Domain of unknown function (DUF1707)/Cell wall-active antibiotics response 4TMS YvqF
MSNLPSPFSEPLPPADRDRVIDALTRHFAADVLTEAQLEARLEAVHAATTRRDLEAIIADLPPLGLAGEPANVLATLAGQERKLTGVVPRDLRVRARFGYVELDLTEASFEPGVTTIDVRSFAGYVEIRVPTGVRVETSGRAFLGYFALTGAAGEAPVVVRVTGRAALGYVEVQLPEAARGNLPTG